MEREEVWLPKAGKLRLTNCKIASTCLMPSPGVVWVGCWVMKWNESSSCSAGHEKTKVDLKMPIDSHSWEMMTFLWNINSWQTIPYLDWGPTIEQFKIFWFQMLYLSIIFLLGKRNLIFQSYVFKRKKEKGRKCLICSKDPKVLRCIWLKCSYKT